MADLSASDAAFLAETLAAGLAPRRDNSQLAGCSVAVFLLMCKIGTATPTEPTRIERPLDSLIAAGVWS